MPAAQQARGPERELTLAVLVAIVIVVVMVIAFVIASVPPLVLVPFMAFVIVVMIVVVIVGLMLLSSLVLFLSLVLLLALMLLLLPLFVVFGSPLESPRPCTIWTSSRRPMPSRERRNKLAGLLEDTRPAVESALADAEQELARLNARRRRLEALITRARAVIADDDCRPSGGGDSPSTRRWTSSVRARTDG